MKNEIQIEICAGSTADGEAASHFEEIDRIELNSHLEEDGLTPQKEVFASVRTLFHGRLIPMVRPRAGSFIYTENEKRQMLDQAEYFLTHGADGIVFGAVNDVLDIDEPFTADMICLIHSFGKTAVFHKAFDVCRDRDHAIQILIRLHADRILTSGGAPDCTKGMQEIGRLNRQYGSQIEILPGGGIRSENVCSILKGTGCHQFHMSLRSTSQTPAEKIQSVLQAIE